MSQNHRPFWPSTGYIEALRTNERPSPIPTPGPPVIMSTQGMANALAPAVVMDTVVGANLLGTTDAQLQAAVEYAAQQLVL
jgi:hypothetical protein